MFLFQLHCLWRTISRAYLQCDEGLPADFVTLVQEEKDALPIGEQLRHVLRPGAGSGRFMAYFQQMYGISSLLSMYGLLTWIDRVCESVVSA